MTPGQSRATNAVASLGLFVIGAAASLIGGIFVAGLWLRALITASPLLGAGLTSFAICAALLGVSRALLHRGGNWVQASLAGFVPHGNPSAECRCDRCGISQLQPGTSAC
jgi:hypothetical protein